MATTGGSLLVNLPTALGSTILFDWGCHSALGRLDSAYCSHSERGTFLSMLQGPEQLEIDNRQQRDSQSLKLYSKLRWMISRKVKCNSFSYTSEPPQEEFSTLSSFINANVAHLDNIVIRSNDTALMLILSAIADSQHALHFLAVGTVPDSDLPAWEPLVRQIVSNSHQCLEGLQLFNLPSWATWEVYFPEGTKFNTLCSIDVPINGDGDLVAICKAAPSLTDLTVTGACCTNIGLAAIGQYCPQWKELVFKDTASLTRMDEGLTAIAEGCKQLERLTLEDCTDLSDVGLTAIATHCTLLEELHLTETDLITDAPLVVLANSADPKLLSLTLRGCHAITGAGVIAIAQRCPLLHTLNLDDSYAITRANMLLIIPHLSHVKALGLFSHGVHDDTLELIAAHMPCLHELNVAAYFDPFFTVNAITVLVEKCPHLQTVQLGEEMLLVMAMVDALQRVRPDICVQTMGPTLGSDEDSDSDTDFE